VTQRGKLAVITGAAGDIGRAMVERFWRDGFEVLGLDRRFAGSRDGCVQFRDGHVGLELDLRHPDSGERLMSWLAARGCAAAVLVNGAAVASPRRLHELRDEEWNDVIGTNLGGAMRVTRAVLGGMIERRAGCIVNIASVDGVARNNNVAYAVAKAGVIRFSGVLARSYGKYGIRANTVIPGFIEGAMLARAFTSSQQAALTAEVPMRRLGRPEDVAGVVAALASDAFGYVSGASVTVDGGYLT
jgi:3-oxoacyl-[acyl-carrier protein] reductase